MENLTQRWTCLGPFFTKSSHFFWETPIPNPSPLPLALVVHRLPDSTSNAKYLIHERNLRVFVPEWDLRPEFNLGFPELNSGYSLREVTTRDMFP